MGKIKLSHGSGGVEMSQILDKLIFSRVQDRLKKVKDGLGIDKPDDAAAIPIDGGYIIVSTDSYTVNPPFFPNNNIGGLAASGTINDILMLGGKPIAALDSIIVEEGFDEEDLETIVDTMLETFKDHNIALIGGDFKVMPRENLDKIIINTVGIGRAEKIIVDTNIKVGDKIIVTGPVGTHGAVILALQEGIHPDELELESDVRPLTEPMYKLFRYIDHIHAARDPTRGGLAMLLNDWAKISNKVIYIDEGKIPIEEAVRSYSELLGIEPYNLASEGVAVLAVEAKKAEEITQILRESGYEDANIIGEVKKADERYGGKVIMRTGIGGLRILEAPRGELVPRIC